MPSIELEPHYPIANAYGVASWHAICESRGDPRVHGDIDELVGYLAAWCALDPARTVAGLAPLLHARTPSLAAGVRADLVLLVPMIDDSAAAQRWFQRANLDVEPEELAAVYDALDRPTEVVALLADGRHQPRSTACSQLARLARADPATFRDLVVGEAHATDPACREVAAYEMCPIVTGTRELTALDTAAELAAAIRHEVATCGPVIGSDVAVAVALRDRWPSSDDSNAWMTFLEVAAAVGAPSTPPIAALRAAAARNALRTIPCVFIDTDILARLAGDVEPTVRDLTPQTCERARRGK